MKFRFKKLLSIAAVFSFLMLIACSEPSTEESEKGSFTISLSVSENTRAVYPPTDTSDLKFAVKFKDTESGEEFTYASDGNEPIQGKIDLGNYIVTMDVSLISDGSLYARGVAYDNPIEIGSGQNFIKVYAYDVKNSSPPVISAKPQGRTYSFGDTMPPLEVSASVNDSGAISYQWYSNTANSVSGATAVSGAISRSYMPSTATPGTAWYYAVVTNTRTGKPTTINTVPVAIIVSSGSGDSFAGTTWKAEFKRSSSLNTAFQYFTDNSYPGQYGLYNWSHENYEGSSSPLATYRGTYTVVGNKVVITLIEYSGYSSDYRWEECGPDATVKYTIVGNTLVRTRSDETSLYYEYTNDGSDIVYIKQ